MNGKLRARPRAPHAAALIGVLLAATAAFAEPGSIELRFETGNIATEVPDRSRQLTGQGASEASFYFSTVPSERVVEPFDSLGINGILPDIPVVLEVARESAAGDWGPWIAMEQHAFEGGRFWAKAVFPSVAPGRVIFRVRGEGMPKSRAVEFYSLEAFRTPKPGPGGKTVAPKRWGRRRPAVVGRAEWGARSARNEEEMNPYRMTVHHTEGARPTSRAAAYRELKVIQNYHMNGRGWDDIGYHFLIDGSGTIYQGRPEYLQGAHVHDENPGNVGIAFMGNYDSIGLTRDQMRSAQDLIRWLAGQYRIGPDNLYGHRNLNPTSCPGSNVYGRVPELRRTIGGRLSVGGAGDDSPPPVLGALRGAGAGKVFAK